jgi:type IV pilus assembly protein PilA
MPLIEWLVVMAITIAAVFSVRALEANAVLFVLPMIITVGSLFSAPALFAHLTITKVDPTAKDIAEAVMRMRADAEDTGPTPYASMTTEALANTLRGHTQVMKVTGTGTAAMVSHGLGGAFTAISAAPATITRAGDAFTISFPGVNKAACPSFAAALRNISQIITINSTAVYSIPSGIAFNDQSAEKLCTTNDTNTFVFTVR